MQAKPKRAEDYVVTVRGLLDYVGFQQAVYTLPPPGELSLCVPLGVRLWQLLVGVLQLDLHGWYVGVVSWTKRHPPCVAEFLLNHLVTLTQASLCHAFKLGRIQNLI